MSRRNGTKPCTQIGYPSFSLHRYELYILQQGVMSVQRFEAWSNWQGARQHLSSRDELL